MKKLLTLMIVAAAALVAAPEAEARPYYSGHTYVSGRSSCGCAIYSQRFISYYDRCGRPIYGHRRLPVTHRCRTTIHHRPQYRTSRTYYNPHSRGHAYGHIRVSSDNSSSRRYYTSRSRCR